jgi:hypothetical protein
MIQLARRRFPIALAAFIENCRGQTYDAFHSPEDVEIRGYTGDAMEPFLTRDGRFLLFNNSNSASVDTNLQWAERVTDLKFNYRGEIAGVNSTALDAVPSLDHDGNLYFVSSRSYPQTRSTVYRSHFDNGSGSAPELVEGVSRATPGWVNFDAEISADGSTLYFVDGYFGTAAFPQTAALVAAVRSGDTFQRVSADPFANINSDALQYAPSLTPDQLELFFTRVARIEASAEPAIYRSIRKRITDPFAAAQRIAAIQGFAEAATISPDAGSLYYHARANGTFRIRRVTRARRAA